MDFNHYDRVADLYDIYVPVSYDIDFFVRETRKAEGEVLELMSGTGRVSIPLLQAGIQLTCVDNSAQSNAVLRGKLAEKGLVAEVYDMDVRRLELPRRFSMVIIPFHSFAHIVDPADQQSALEGIARHLQPGGIFICTLSNPSVRRKAVDGQLRLANTYTLPENEKLLLWIVEQFDPEDGEVVQAFEFFEHYAEDGGMTFRRLLELHFRLTPKETFEEMLGQAGFSIEAVYGDYAYHDFDANSSPSLVWVSKKK